MRRRDLLGGLLTSSLTAPYAAAQAAPPPVNPQTALRDDVVGTGFSRLVIARWGDAVLPNAPPFTPNALTELQASTQFPYDGTLAGLVTPPAAQDGIARFIIVTANPSAPARMLFPGGGDVPAIAGREQGATVMNLQYLGGRWVSVAGGYQNRRLTDGTLCAITGPAAAAIGQTVQGILAPQAGCTTHWNSTLLAEGHATAWLQRLADVGYGYADPAQAARFGWIVEFDTLNPLAIPAKRTALGRVARAGITATTAADGRPVIFFTQDDPAGRLFRFIGSPPADRGNPPALDSGTLAVARISGTGIVWKTLGTDLPTLAGLAGAAAQAGGSAFDSPGGLVLAKDDSALYLACSGNSARTTANALNPRTGDDNGHVIRFLPPGGDVTAKHFSATLVLVAGNPGNVAGTQYAPGSTAWARRPRTLGLDEQGVLWIGTDQQGDTAQTADGLFTLPTPGAMPGPLSAAYLAPKGAAMGGVAFAPATQTIFAMVRHPGATPSASFNFPATRWPTLRPDMPPQSTLIALVRNET